MRISPSAMLEEECQNGVNSRCELAGNCHHRIVKTIEKKSSAGKGAKRVVRINPRFPQAVAAQLREASAIRGQSVATFVLEAASHAAARVLEEETRWRMGTEESAVIQRMLLKPPRVNAAATEAAKRLAADVRIRS
jgi:uncharacterized protein (DUF1778 family)